MGRKTHGPHLLVAIDANDHAKVHELLAVQIRNKAKIRDTCTADIKRLASENVDCPFMLAAAIPDPTIIRYMVVKHGVDVNFKHQKGLGKRIKLHTALMVAVKRGLYHTVEVLLEQNANTNLQDHKGRTALHHAVYQANYRMAKMLLTKGAQPNLTDRLENSALHVATKFGHLELVKLLMQYGGDLYKRGQYGAIPLHIAAKDGHISLIEWFATHGSNINVRIPCFAEMREKTPLHVACEEGHIEAVLTLIQKCKADVNISDSEGETPLHCTVLHEYDPFGMKSKDDYADTALVLLKFGADVNKKNERGETALHHASRNEFQKVAELLVRAGTDPLVEDHDNNKAIDLVSDDDAVTKNLLKRAVNDREKLMNELLEIKARGFSTSSQSLNMLMMNNSMSPAPNGPMSQSMMHIPGLGQGLVSRTNSTPGLFMPDGSMIYSQDGYLQPFTTRPRLGSIGSAASFGVQSFAGMPLSRQDSIGSFHSAMTAPVNTYCSIDSDGVVSESAVAGVVAPRLIRRKRGTEKRISKELSSDSSQYEDIPVKHSTPRRSASVDIINTGQRKAKKPKAPLFIQPIGKKHKGISRGDKTRQSQNSLSSQASTLSKASSKSDSSSIWDVTPYTSQSTLRADGDDTSECPSSRSTPDGSRTPRALTDEPPSPNGEDVTDGDIYENMPCDEPQPIYDNIPDESPGTLRRNAPPPAPPPRTRRPLPPVPKHKVEEAKKALPPPPPPPVSSPPVSPDVIQTPPALAPGDRSSQEITIKISPHQSITIRTSPNGQAQAIQVNSLLPEDQPPVNDFPSGMDSTVDSDDTFFDDESFETISDMLEPEGRKPKPIPPPKPTHLRRKRKPSKEQIDKVLEDPKLQNWLAEQAVILKDRKDHGPGPIAQSTPPISRRELENKLRQAFGKPPLSESETESGPDPRKVVPVPQQQVLLPAQGPQKDSADEDSQFTKMDASPGAKRRGAFVEYSKMNDLNAPGRSVIKPVPHARNPEVSKPKVTPIANPMAGGPKSPQGGKPQWEKVPVDDEANDTSQASLYWDHTEDTIARKGHKLNTSTHSEVVYMEMNGNAPKVEQPQAVTPKANGNHEAFNQQLQQKLQQQQQQFNVHPIQQKSPNNMPQQAPTAESDDFDDDSFESFDSDSDDEGIPNSCHQVARHFRLPPQTDGVSNLVLATPSGEIVPHTRHSSTNSRLIPVPGAEEMADRMAEKAPLSPKKGKNVTPKARADIVVVRDGALVNGMPLNRPSPGPIKRSNSIQDQRNAQLVTAIKQSPVAVHTQRSNSISENSQPQDMTRSPSHTSLGNISRRDSMENGHFVTPETASVDESPTQRQRKVTIGSEKIKLISDEESLPKDHDHRRVEYDTKGRVRITIIGGNSDGVFIHRIDPGSEAEQKGLMEGDQILKINGVSANGKTKEEVTLQLMNLQDIVSLLVRHKKDRYNSIRLNGGMGDSFFVKAFFTHDPKQKGEMKIHEGDIFSVRDTLPNGRIGSWQALKVNAKPNETQHGLIPNEARAEQVALASRKATERGRGLEKENRGSFIRRSLRRSKSAERLHKENEAFTKSQVPQLEEVRTYERVEQRAPGFLRPVIILGLFCDTVRDRMMQDLPGMFDKPPPEVEIPTAAEAGAPNKVPVDIRLIQDIIRNNKHPLMIMSPRAIQYLVTNTKLYPIVIYLTPGSKDVVKKLRLTLAPGFSKRSSYMFEESQLFAKTYAHLFTATVTYTANDSWYALLKDTVKRIQNQPLWQSVGKNVGHRDDIDERLQGEGPEGESPNSENRLPRLGTSARIPDPIRNVLQRHAIGGSSSDVTDAGAVRPRQMTLTYDGYFLSDGQQAGPDRSPTGGSLHNGHMGGQLAGMNAYSSGNARSMNDILGESQPKSILKTRSPSTQGLVTSNGHHVLDEVSPPKKYQQIGLMVPVAQQEENNNGMPRTPSAQKLSPQQLAAHQQMMQQQMMFQQQQQQQQMQAAHHHQQQAAAQQMMIQQMFQQQFVQQQQQQMAHQSPGGNHDNPPLTRPRGLTHEVSRVRTSLLRDMFTESGLSAGDIDDILYQLSQKPPAQQRACVKEMIDLWARRYHLAGPRRTSRCQTPSGHVGQSPGVRHKSGSLSRGQRQCRSLDDLDSIETDL